MGGGAAKPAAENTARSRRRRASDPGFAGLAEAQLTPEIRTVLARLATEREDLRRELADARAEITRLERLADEDALTPVANRRAFVRELTRMIAFTKRYGVPSSVVYFDVDGMKQINDVHGHPAGDAALRQIAKILVDSVRSSDVVGRLGGDEFGVILSHANQDQANAKAAALAAAIARTPLCWDGAEIALSAAHGVYSFAGGDDAHVAIEAADREMYSRKRAPRE